MAITTMHKAATMDIVQQLEDAVGAGDTTTASSLLKQLKEALQVA